VTPPMGISVVMLQVCFFRLFVRCIDTAVNIRIETRLFVAMVDRRKGRLTHLEMRKTKELYASYIYINTNKRVRFVEGVQVLAPDHQ